MRWCGWVLILVLSIWPALLWADSSHEAVRQQRGAALFVQDCAACHSLKYLRPRQLQQDWGVVPVPGMALDTPMMSALPADVAALAFGRTPPDLSLVAQHRGAAWIKAYLKGFYLDTDGHWNNQVLPHAAMPNPFWQAQGISQRGPDGQMRQVRAGKLSPQAFQFQLDDLAAFLQYAADPSLVERHALAPWVLGFLVLFCGLAYATMRAHWKRVRLLPGPSDD